MHVMGDHDLEANHAGAQRCNELVAKWFRVDSVTVVRNAGTRIASDHFPVVADLRRA